MFTRRHIAVYLDGCFWHGCPAHGVIPTTNGEYWAPKLARNKERDAQATLALEAAGWAVLRFWEHEDTDAVADVIETVVRAAPLQPPARPALRGVADATC